jgi:hypothetical protein
MMVLCWCCDCVRISEDKGAVELEGKKVRKRENEKQTMWRREAVKHRRREEQRSRGAEEQRSREAGKQRSRGVEEEQRRAGKQRSRGETSSTLRMYDMGLVERSCSRGNTTVSSGVHS